MMVDFCHTQYTAIAEIKSFRLGSARCSLSSEERRTEA